MKLFWSAALFLILLGCTTAYKPYPQPRVTDPHARVMFSKSFGSDPQATYSSQGRRQFFYVLPKGVCSGPQVVAEFYQGPTLGHGNTASKRLEANEPLTLLSYIVVRDNDGGYPYAAVNKTACPSLIQFVPEVGKSYEIQVDYRSMQHCQMVIRDAESGRKPDGVKRENLCTDEDLSAMVDILLKSSM